MRERVRSGRRAVVLTVPPPVATAIDDIRMRWDPIMCGRIGAHITLLHDVVDDAGASDAIAAAASSTPPFQVRLTDTAHWGQSAYGVYLHVVDVEGGVSSLHSQLARFEDPRWARVSYRPHVTLVHSRTTEPAVAAAAWAVLEGFHAGWEVAVTTIDVIELDASGWRTVGCVELAGTGSIPSPGER